MNKEVRLAYRDSDLEIRLQLAALCWNESKDGTRILLITSRDTGRWVLPKGWPMADRSNADAALTEAWEEAGVTGATDGFPVGNYSYDKVLCRDTDLALRCDVEVYPVRVASLARKYPEYRQRRRKWFSPEKAARKVDEPDLQQLILAFAAGNAKPNGAKQDGSKQDGGQV
ncbi:NUDIX hydrolase [Paracoccus sp. IB05]|nr:NUDIX hydrolase [Paracoccus sp. IB05]